MNTIEEILDFLEKRQIELEETGEPEEIAFQLAIFDLTADQLKLWRKYNASKKIDVFKDVAGNELFVGDKVVTNIQGYKQLRVMIVTGFTKKLVTLTNPEDSNDFVNRPTKMVAKLFNQNV